MNSKYMCVPYKLSIALHIKDMCFSLIVPHIRDMYKGTCYTKHI